MRGISIIVCCYNSADRLPKTLYHLANQVVDATIEWEVVLVNNNSKDNTSEIAKKLWAEFKNSIPFQVVHEEKSGLSYAREKGMGSAQFDIFLFCDDDNWLSKNYVQIVYETFRDNPELGALGGWCEPRFEIEKPQWFDRFSSNFAVGKPIEQTGFLTKPKEYLYGAGLAIHKTAIQALTENKFTNILSDRKEKQLSSGGDVELIYALKLMRFPIYFEEALFFFHFMPKERMNWDYLNRLRTSMYWSNFVLSIYVDTQKGGSYGLRALINKIVNDFRYIRKNEKRLIDLDRIEVLFLKNQIEVRKLFLRNILLYIQIRNKLKRLKSYSR